VGPEPVAARLAEARSRLREPSEVTEALDISAEEAIEELAEAGRLATEAPEPPSFEPPPIKFEPPPIDFRPESRDAEAEVARELSRERSRGRGSPRPGPDVDLGR
jgi:hypothetical protein